MKIHQSLKMLKIGQVGLMINSCDGNDCISQSMILVVVRIALRQPLESRWPENHFEPIIPNGFAAVLSPWSRWRADELTGCFVESEEAFACRHRSLHSHLLIVIVAVVVELRNDCLTDAGLLRDFLTARDYTVSISCLVLIPTCTISHH